MDTTSAENIDQISSLVDGLSSISSDGGSLSTSALNIVGIESNLIPYIGSIYSRIALVLGLGVLVFLRILKEKIKANIRAKAFEKRAQKTQRKELEKKPNQEDIIKNIFNGIK